MQSDTSLSMIRSLDEAAKIAFAILYDCKQRDQLQIDAFKSDSKVNRYRLSICSAFIEFFVNDGSMLTFIFVYIIGGA